MKRITPIIIVILSLAPLFLTAQSSNLAAYANRITSENLKSAVTFLANDLCRGRQTGSRGIQLAGTYIKDKFKEFGLTPLSGSNLYKSFKMDTLIGRNIIGVIESDRKSDEYIVISAHYDYLGAFEGNIYNGADDNASGVSVLITLADLFSQMKKNGEAPVRNIIFVAFDGKESNMAGSENFFKQLPFSYKKIKFNINIDQIGSTFAPPGKSANYILVLGADGKNFKLRDRIDFLNIYSRAYLDLDFTFYGSKAFASIFYRASDQILFAEKGIPALLFTSGITAHTYKPSDDADLLDYNVMANRTKLILFTVCDILNP